MVLTLNIVEIHLNLNTTIFFVWESFQDVFALKYFHSAG